MIHFTKEMVDSYADKLLLKYVKNIIEVSYLK